jgi:glyoxylase-like metal-dependent hydrolase (beta-lactamase superfamily II)
MAVDYERGLTEVGEGVFAYLQPDGSWGWSNAGLVSGAEGALLVDTLYDLALTERMLEEMRRAVPAAAHIQTLVNTHGNGDHCYGNQLLDGARIVASQSTAQEMSELPPTAMAMLIEQAPNMGALGEFFLRCFGDFDFKDIELAEPTETFSGELTLDNDGVAVQLIEVGPAHTRGDTLAWLPSQQVLFSGDILFNGAHPIAWAGPVSNWIAACERIEALAPQTIVPGHGPLASVADVREQRAYFEYLYAQACIAHEQGMKPLQAARWIELDRWAQWGERERLAVNIATIFGELDGTGPLTPLAGFQLMAEAALDLPEGAAALG